MIRPFAAMLLAALCAPPVLAADLTVFMGGEAEYDDNAFRRENDPEDELFFRIRPGVKIHEDRGDDLNFSLQYELPAEFAVDNSEELNDVDHLASGDFTYHVSDRLDVTGSERFRYLRSTLRRNIEEGSVEDQLGIPSIAEERDRVRRNDAQLAATYSFAPRLSGRLSASHGWFDSTRENRSEVNTLSGTANLFYALTGEHQVGGGGRFTFQDFEESAEFSGSQTYIYNLFGSWRWTIDETTALDVTAGPSLIDTRQDDTGAVTLRRRIPFSPIGGFTAPAGSGLVDENGTPLDGEFIEPDSVLVGNPNVCQVVGGEAVFPCASNIVVEQSSNPALWDAIVNETVAVTNQNPRGERETEINFFAEVVFTKRWLPTLASALRYSREQGNASGLGGTVILDAVSLSNTWDFAERWQLSLRGAWTRRESISDQTGTFLRASMVDPADLQDSPSGTAFLAGFDDDPGTFDAFNAKVDTFDIETNRWGLAGRITHRLFRNTRMYAQVTYDQQESDSGTRGAGSDFDTFIATVGVRHVFEPLKLW